MLLGVLHGFLRFHDGIEKERRGNCNLLVWNESEWSCGGLLWYALPSLSPPAEFLASQRRKCHGATMQWIRQGCVPNHSRSPTTAGCEEEGNHLCTKRNTINDHDTQVKKLSAQFCIPIFQVPTNTEITSGSLSWECLVFISWTSWQKASPFWKKEQSFCELWLWKQMLIRRAIPLYPCTLEGHLPRHVVEAVNHQANLCRTTLVLDNLQDFCTSRQIRPQMCMKEECST